MHKITDPQIKYLLDLLLLCETPKGVKVQTFIEVINMLQTLPVILSTPAQLPKINVEVPVREEKTPDSALPVTDSSPDKTS